MKSKGLIVGLIVFLILLIASLTIVMVKMMNGNFMFAFGHNVSKNKILEETYEVMDINVISEAADIHVIESTDDKVKVVVYSEQKRTSVKTINNKLVIDSKAKKCRGFCFNTKIDKIEVYIPSSYQNKINIDGDAGDIKVGNFKNLVLDIETDAGDVDIGSIKKANIKTDAGDIDIDNINSIKIEADAGDIKVNSINEYVNIKTDAGDIRIEKLNIIKNSNIKLDAGDVRIKSTNNIYVDSKTHAGDIKVHNSNRKSDIELSIKTNAGDIRVN